MTEMSGIMTRYVPWLAELQPSAFGEIDPELAVHKGIKNGDWVTVSTALGEIEARALVSGRMRPLRLGKGQARASDRRAVQLRQLVALARGDSVGALDPDLARSQRLDPRSEDDDVQHPARTPAAYREGPRDEPVPATNAATSGNPRRVDEWRHNKREQLHRKAKRSNGNGFLHRHDAVHRLQGVRGRVQAVERAAGRRVRVHRQLVRQHVGTRGTTWRHVAFVEQMSVDEAVCRSLADDERRVQTLHERRLHGSVSDRRDHPQRVRRRLHPARRLQRLRLLRAVVSRSASST